MTVQTHWLSDDEKHPWMGGGLEVKVSGDSILIHQIDYKGGYEHDAGIRFPMRLVPWLKVALDQASGRA